MSREMKKSINKTQKMLIYLLAVIMIVALVPTAAFAETKAVSEVAGGSCGTNLTWSLSSNGTLTISGKGVMPGYSVSREAPWYSYQSRITSVVIEKGVENISTRAFYGCRSIASVSIPDSVTQIWGSAFYECESLAIVIIPNSVIYLGANAFYGCESLTEVILSQKLGYIYDYTFFDCEKLRDVVIPDGVTFIGEKAFAWCDNLHTVAIPKSVTSIAAGAFDHYNYSSYGVSSVKYGGSKSDWEKITIGANNEKLLSATKYYNVLAPSIKTQSTDVTVSIGDTAKFKVVATGDDLTYQWQYRTSETGKWKNSTASSATKKTIKLKGTTSKNGYQYRCKITDANGFELYTDAVTLHVFGIAKQPGDATVAPDTTAKFTVTATGENLTYQWQYRTSEAGKWKNSTASSATKKTVKVKGTAARNGYQYRCQITDANGTVIYTDVATLHVVSLAIAKQPSDITVSTGATAEFTVTATGAGLTYQWQYRTSSTGKWKNSNASSATKETVKVKGTTSKDGYQYRCKVTDGADNVLYSDAVTLFVADFTLDKQPENITVSSGKTAKFTVATTGDVTYQWQYRTSEAGKWKDSTASSATKKTVSVKGTTARNGYQYRCKITDSNGKVVYTKAVTLTVN